MGTVPGYPETGTVELSKEIWPTVSRVVHSVTIALESGASPVASDDDATRSAHIGVLVGPQNCRPRQSASRQSLPDTIELLTLHNGIPPASSSPTRSQTGSPAVASSLPLPTPQRALSEQSSNLAQTIEVTLPPLLFGQAPAPFEIKEVGLLQKKISQLYQIIETRAGYSPLNSRLTYLGTQLDNDLTLADYNVASGDSIVVALGSRPANPVRRSGSPPRMRKPIIYLYPPSSLPHVTVDLQLTSSWRFSAVYPSPQTTVPFEEHQPARSLTWAITAEPDGTLVEKTTGAEVSYLYWEAR